MKILKRIILVLLALLVLAQIPFIYRRYQTGQLAEKIAQLEAQRTTYQDPNFKEYKGIIHAHTNLGGHSTGTFDELIAAANANDLDFVLMTEHVSDTVDTAALTLNGVYGKTLFIGGNELDTSDGDRFLLIPGGGGAAKARVSGTTAFLDAAHRENKLALITYPERFKSWDLSFDGIEVFSLHTSAKQMNWLTALGDLIWTYPGYPELMIAKSWTPADTDFRKVDELIAAQRKVSVFAGTDAHSNIGFHLFGDDAGSKLINIKLDPYEMVFRLVRIHVLIPAEGDFNRDTLIEAIRSGRYFIGFDVIGDTSGFQFRAESSAGSARMGDSVVFQPGLVLKVVAPQNARIYFSENSHGKPGGSITVNSQREYTWEILAPGTYRVEVYRDDLGPPFDKIPWIISNPIYVR